MAYRKLNSSSAPSAAIVSVVWRLAFLLLLSTTSMVGEVGASPVEIKAIAVEGNKRIEEATVLLQVTSEVGKPLSSAAVEKDIRSVFLTGYFQHVEAKLRGETLVFVVVERPAVRKVEISGNDELARDKVEEQLNIGARKFLDRRKINLGVEQLKRTYQEKGYYGTEVEYKISEVGEGEVDLEFVIKEGKEKLIRQVLFEGNEKFPADDLAEKITTGEYRWWSSWFSGTGVVKEEQLERDVAQLTQFYLSRGHVDVKVGRAEVLEVEDGLAVVYRIQEGEEFAFGDITVSGDLLEAGREKTLEGVKCQAGEVFDVGKLREDAFLLAEKFTDIGYAFTNVDPNTTVDRLGKRVDIDFAVNKGDLVTVNRILISGNKKTRDNVIRRSLKITERELFSSSKIKRSQELLKRLGYFDEVTITSTPTSVPNEVDLAVAVREGNTGTFSAGAGFSSGDGFIVNSRISETNLFGSGNSLSLDLDNGTRNQNYVLSFDNPRLNDSNWSMGWELLKTKRQFSDFDREQAGGSLNFGYPLWFLGPKYLDDVRFGLGYELLAIDITEVEKDAPPLVIDQAGSSSSSAIVPRLTRNTIDNPLDPTTGSRQTLRLDLAGIGGSEEYWLTQFNNSYYHPLWNSPLGKLVFSQRFRFGWGETFDGEDFPLFKRFFPGGINSVRGYQDRGLGPEDEEGNEYGGNKQLIANFDLIFPLIESFGLKGVVFYDIGNAFDDDEQMELAELRQAVGWGIRWRTPLAPIRVEIGYPLDREAGEKPVVVNFSFGAPL